MSKITLEEFKKKMQFDLKSMRICLNGKHNQHHNYTFKHHSETNEINKD